jgi:hypothetical protein
VPVSNKKIVFYSVIVSVLAHLVVLTGATYVKIPGVYFALRKTKRFFNLDKLIREEAARRPAEKQRPTYTEVLKFESPQYVETAAGYSAEEEAKKPSLAKPEESITEPIAMAKQEDVSQLIEDEKDHEMLRKKLDRQTRAELVGAPEIEAEGDAAGAEALLAEAMLPEEFIDKMPGFTPRITTEFDSILQKDTAEATKPRAAFIERETDFKDLNQLLVYDLYTYQDPKDKQKYYQLNIRSGKDTADVQAIPKEIVFLVDCSLSIQPERLQEIKKGLEYSLRNLNAEDYFNIVAFKRRLLSFRQFPIKPNEQVIREALDFVGGLTSEEGTDTYNALYKTIQTDTTVDPSYIVLFSDGRPTQGVTNSREIINKITSFNDGKRPIFAFSGGIRVNRYFLDFISYKNRGWSEHAYRTPLIDKHIASMYNKIKDPLFLNLRYRVSGLEGKEAFPKSLPDFFRNAEFTLYGTYKDEDEFSLQFLGDSDGKTSEFIIVDSLSKALKGNKAIARNWAFNKIYYLIGLLEYDKKNEKILREIDYLTDKFKIKTPYSTELQK